MTFYPSVMQKYFSLACSIGLAQLLLTIPTSGAENQAPYLDSQQPVETRVEDLLSRMTLEEKISQVHADSKFSTAAVPRLGIPRRWVDDGPHGVREDVGPYSWNAVGGT